MVKRRLLFAPTFNDVRRMFGVADERDRLIIRILAYCGLREAELVGSKKQPGLHLKHIDFKRKMLIIYGKGWASGKRPPEEQPIDSGTLEMIKEYIKKRGIKKGKLFDLSTRQIQRIVKETAIKAENKFKEGEKWEAIPEAKLMSPHRLRAFFITEMINRFGIARAKFFARHTDIRLTQRYDFPRKIDLLKQYESVFEEEKA